MRTVMQNRFSQIPNISVPRSTFDRSHGYKTTFDAGWLIPIFVDEALPGDTHVCHLTAFARMTTPIVPIMDNLFMDFFFFSVPNRLLWDNWERFNGSQDNPTDSTNYLTPIVGHGPGSALLGTLYDYLGVPVTVNAGSFFEMTAFHTRAYNLIWNEWFRDQNLQDSVVVDLDDGPDNPGDYVLLKRGKRYDYFTSALPWPQKGPAVSLPLGSSALVQLQNAAAAQAAGETGIPIFRDAASLAQVGAADASIYTFDTGGGVMALTANLTNGNNPPFYTPGPFQTFMFGAGTDSSYDPAGTLYADLSNATAATINALRQAFQLQAFFERDARGGTRYTEIIRAHFGVVSPDARLQRPEYIGGGSIPININPVAQTSAAAAQPTPQGNLAAFAVGSGQGVGFTYTATEHCVLLGLVSVRADLTYSQGLERMWSKRTRYEYYWPAFSQLGEQAILNQEIFFDPDVSANNSPTWGYQERYAEYRYKPSRITGLFRPGVAGSIDVWHLSQEFASLPGLDDLFIQDDPPVDRVIAVPSQPQFLYDSYIQLRSTRPMPVYGVPSALGGRF